MLKWVQHISGHGKKWEVMNGGREFEWRVKADGPAYYHDLPKCEYEECDPPEEWENVTGECSWVCLGSNQPATIYHNEQPLRGEYRFRKLDGMHNGPHFIIERKKS